MKVLHIKSSPTYNETIRGWKNALDDFTFIEWDSRKKPAFDAFDETQPDLFIGTVEDIGRGMATCLKENPNIITIFYTPKFNNVSEENISYVDELKKDTGKPDLIFGFHPSPDWEWLGYQYHHTQKAADTKIFKEVENDRAWSSTISCLIDYTKDVNEFILPLCRESYGHQIRIFGNRWPVYQGLGKPNPDNISKIFSSSQIILNLDNESDTPYNVFACGGFCLTRDGGSDLFPSFSTPAELREKINFYIENPGKKQKERLEIKHKVIEGHTYTHRVEKLLEIIDGI